MKTIEEIMGMVDAFASAVEDTVLSDSDCYKENAEMRAYKAIESALRELVERKPLNAHQRLEVLHAIPDDDDAEEEWLLTDKQIQLIIDGVERAHGIGA